MELYQLRSFVAVAENGHRTASLYFDAPAQPGGGAGALAGSQKRIVIPAISDQSALSCVPFT